MIAELVTALSIQASTPDYAQQAQDLSRLATAVQVCDIAGYRPRPTAIQEERETFDRRLRAEGVAPDRIGQLAGDANRIENNQLARAMDLPGGVPNEETRAFAREARGFLYRRCAEAKATFPGAFEPVDTEQRVFMGYLGLWVDHKLVEETEYYLSSRGACSSFLPAFDAHDAAQKLSRPFASEPSVVRASLEDHYRTAFREGLAMGTDFDSVQCSRVMRAADQALGTAWRIHYDGNPPHGPFAASN